MLKPVSMQSTASVVSVLDPAVDQEASSLEEYIDKRRSDPSCWRNLLKFKDGQQPTVFVIGAIQTDDIVRIHDECRVYTGEERSSELRWRSFLLGVRDVEGFGVKPQKIQQGEDSRVAVDWLKETFVRGLRVIAMEIGSVVWSWNSMTEDDAKN